MTHTTYITIPRHYRKSVTRLFINSAKLKLNVIRAFTKKQSDAEIIEGFRQRYATDNLYNSYIDGTIEWYLNPIYHYEADLSEIPNTKDILALDLGCGPASVCYWLRANDYMWEYMGVDIVKDAKKYIKPLNRASFIVKRIEKLTIDDLPQKPDIIFAVNSFCYVQELEECLYNLFNISKGKAKLIIIDGYPSAFWNNKSIAKFRSTKDFQEILSASGWIPKRKLILSIYNMANIPMMNISHSFLCERA